MTHTELLIIGGGFAGASAAQKLAEAGFQTLLVDRKDYFEVTYSTLRDVAAPELLRQSPRKRYIDFLKGDFIQSGVKTLSQHQAELENGETIHFDKAIIASGSRYPTLPMVKSHRAMHLNARHDEMKQSHQQIKAANHILILGGGVVGVELAGEIAHAFPNKKITLAHNKNSLLDTFKPRAQKLALQQLKVLGVNIETHRRYQLDGEVYKDANTGDALQPDLVFLAIGTQPNTEFLKKYLSEALDEKGYINVNQQLKVLGFDNLYALGDAANTGSHKLGYIAAKQGEYLAKNIIAEKIGKRAKPYKPMKHLMALIPTGAKSGLVQMPLGVTQAKCLVNIKQKDLFIGKTYQGLGAMPDKEGKWTLSTV